jgi:hypothetical protein
MTPYQKKVQEKIPETVKAGKKGYYYGMLISYIRDHKIKGKRELIKSLKGELDTGRKVLAQKGNTGAFTNNDERRNYARMMKVVEHLLKLAEKYL